MRAMHSILARASNDRAREWRQFWHVTPARTVDSFWDAGFVVLYRFELETDVVYVLDVRHQREACYQ